MISFHYDLLLILSANALWFETSARRFARYWGADVEPMNIEKNAPIRLETAAKIAFPDGSVKIGALRKQVDRGRLVAWEIGGKHFTSLNEIERMVEKCRVTPSNPDSGSGEQGERRKTTGPKMSSRTSEETE